MWTTASCVSLVRGVVTQSPMVAIEVDVPVISPLKPARVNEHFPTTVLPPPAGNISTNVPDPLSSAQLPR